MKLIFRPLDGWPVEKDPDPTRSPFKAGWSDTLDILDREVWNLRDRRTEHEPVILQVDVPEAALRLDGALRADARAKYHGVILSFESKHGGLRYMCDRYSMPSWGRGSSSAAWQDNVRAIALGLEALRKVERYGIARDGQQYRGWNALGTGTPMGSGMTRDLAFEFLVAASGWEEADLVGEGAIDRAYRHAAKRLHPDGGGDPEQFRKLTLARDILLAS